MFRYHIWTIGCQMNQAESERLAARFEETGGISTEALEKADVIVLNSCVVRQGAEDRVINKLHLIGRLKRNRPQVTIALTGCMVNSETARLEAKYPFIDYFFPPGSLPPWLKDGALPALPRRPAPAAFVPISQGCNNYCSYCIVPYRRGPEKSRPAGEIVGEVEELARRGAREIILLGQNVDSYGHDLSSQPDLAELLAQLNGIKELARLRFLTNHPRDMTPRLVRAMAGLEKVCQQVSLPVQSGNDAILDKMKRGYSTNQYRELIAELRSQVPGIAISTDIIVGFPSETEAQFQDTLDLLTELKFDTVHVAAYSPRPGTLAAREFADDVPVEEKKRRLAAVESCQAAIQGEINQRFLGRTVEVLVEGRKNGKWYGRTRTDKLVFFPADTEQYGRLVNVKIEKTSPWALQGTLI